MYKLKNALLLTLLINCSLISAQPRDSVVLYDYYLVTNIVPRTGVKLFDVGLERIKPIKNSIYYAVQISINGGKIHNLKPENEYNPKFMSFCIQPFHLLLGESLKFETGPSITYSFFNYRGRSYPIDDSVNFAYNTAYVDRLSLVYLMGLRYTFKKPQIAIRFIIGIRYVIGFGNSNSFLTDAGAMEFGLNWRFRKRIKR